MLTPGRRAFIARWAALVALVAWPVTQLTVARGEPPFTLGLSWLAIVMTLADLSATTDVREHEDGDTHVA